MHDYCTRAGELGRAEMSVIQSHIAKHKWYRHIEGDLDALMSFNEEFGPLLRDMFCRFACEDRHDCELMLKGLQDTDGDDE